MIEHWINDEYDVIKEKLLPIAIKDYKNITESQELLSAKPASVSFSSLHCANFTEKGAYIVLDFGKEVCGSIRLVTNATCYEPASFRITLGESLSEACSSIGEKNSTNDHSPRDFEVQIPHMSDLTFGLSGFRFARIELLSEKKVSIRNIYAINTMPYFEKEGYIKTSDPELNKIIETAAYTLKLCFQNGYIWDGIKRDRLVWCGDLNQEIITSLYLYGDNKNITNSLSFLAAETPATHWINTIPSYSAWWIINLCDYCNIAGNTKYFEDNKAYAKDVLEHFDACIAEDGTMTLTDPPRNLNYFLDWPTLETSDAMTGTAAVIVLAAKKYLAMEDNSACHSIIKKLEKYLELPCEHKQTRAFQILAGRSPKKEDSFLEENGADGFSTFMAYYILSADALAGGQNILSIIKEYFGGMLSRGATTFWEDFHLDWLNGSGRIDEFPESGQTDIHGDYGAFCYTKFRHSLCHGWASGVLAFIYEYMLGLKLSDGGNTYEVSPNTLGIHEIEAKIPTKTGWIHLKVVDGEVIEIK